MKWSWRIARVAGIDVYLHATFLILLAWVGLSHYLARHSLGDAANGLLFISTLFGVVVLHELGHALAARRYGIRMGVTLPEASSVQAFSGLDTASRRGACAEIAAGGKSRSETQNCCTASARRWSTGHCSQ